MKIAREGIVYIAMPGVLMIISFAMGFWLVGILLLVLTAFMAFFFRDPDRPLPTDTNLVVAPADGRVTRVTPVDSNDQQGATLVSIFLSPLDVHINRSPIAGEITSVHYVKGKFLMATDERASLLNEQNSLTIRNDKVTVVCKQVAGILARRIICWKKAGDHLALGERFGLIKFSSRTDVLMPANVEVTITQGKRVQGGTTIIGRVR